MSIKDSSFFSTDAELVSFCNLGKNELSRNLSLDEIHVWYTNIDSFSQDILTSSKQGNSILTGTSSPKKRFENSRNILRYLLSNYLKCAPETIFFEKEAYGKPFVSGFQKSPTLQQVGRCNENLKSKPSQISFSITHSGKMMLLAFSRHKIGIDLELVRPVHANAIAKKFFSSQEYTFLQQLAPKNSSSCSPEDYDQLNRGNKEKFFQLWTAKEAALKADGRGITKGLRVAFSILGKNSVTSIRLPEQEWKINSCCFSTGNFSNKNQFIAALAYAFSPTLIRWYDFNEVIGYGL